MANPEQPLQPWNRPVDESITTQRMEQIRRTLDGFHQQQLGAMNPFAPPTTGTRPPPAPPAHFILMHEMEAVARRVFESERARSPHLERMVHKNDVETAIDEWMLHNFGQLSELSPRAKTEWLERKALLIEFTNHLFE